MTWETVWSISKLIAVILAVIAAVTTIAKVWTATAKDKLIETLDKELVLSREHIEQCDRDVRHYREEMHSLRGECNSRIIQKDAELEFARSKLKEVEVENARLLSLTDLTPVMESLNGFIKEQRNFTKEQTAINERVLAALQQLTKKVEQNNHAT